MSRHIKSCLGKHFKSKSSGKSKPLYYLYIHATYDPDYFLHILIADNAHLQDLDNFIRDIWLECCGHLSAFMHPGSHGEINMKKKINMVFEPGLSLQYMYDFGDTTELTVKNIDIFTGTTEKNKKVQIVSRNSQPPILCDECDKNQAKIICVQCQWEGEGWLCKKCAKTHECDDEMYLPVVNSPRAGICGYTGD
jgi:hypothetical protein